MAFLNYLSPTAYTTVDHVNYDREERSVRWKLKIWADASKQVQLATKDFEVRGTIKRRGVLAMNVTVPPENPKVGDAYIVGQGATGAWADFATHLAEWTGNPNWRMWYFAPSEIVYNAADDSYYQYQVDPALVAKPGVGEFVKVLCTDDYRVFDKYFDWSTAMTPAETNIVKQIYLYLKILPGFENIQDV